MIMKSVALEKGKAAEQSINSGSFASTDNSAIQKNEVLFIILKFLDIQTIRRPSVFLFCSSPSCHSLALD